jgi:hypothetical protein
MTIPYAAGNLVPNALETDGLHSRLDLAMHMDVAVAVRGEVLVASQGRR